jgi:hypothetical protein
MPVRALSLQATRDGLLAQQQEQQMRENRDEMRRRGLTRSVNPTKVAGRRVWEDLAARFRLYPSCLVMPVDELEVLDLPRKFRAPPQEPLFGPGTVSLPDGTEMDLGSYERVRYAVMLRSIGFEPPIIVPTDGATAGLIVDAYEAEMLRFREDARECAAAQVGGASVHDVVAEAERLWLRASRDAGMAHQERTRDRDQNAAGALAPD